MRMEAGARPSTCFRCRKSCCSSCSEMRSGDVWENWASRRTSRTEDACVRSLLPLRWRAQIAIREHWNRKIWTVRPVTVVADTPDVIALYMMPGTTYKHPRAIDGSSVPHLLPDEWVLVDTQWLGGGALYLSQPGQWYVILGLFGDDNQRIERWYVNLQTPYQR